MKLALRAMIEVLQTRRGPTTRALDVIFTPPYSGLGFAEVKRIDGLNTPLAPWGVTLMLNAGATLAEVLHINAWPDDVKEKLRDEVLAPAVDGGRKVRFFWEPTSGSVASFDRVDPGVEGDVDVIFRTPWSKVSQTAADEYTVDPQ